MKNGKRFKTVAERISNFRKFCDRERCSDCPLSDGPGWECGIRWLELDDDKEPIECPFCGGECHVHENGSLLNVACSEFICAYSGPLRRTREEAVAAHNRVARLVADAKDKERESDSSREED